MPPPFPMQAQQTFPGMGGAVPVLGASSYPPEFSYGLPANYGSHTGAASWAASGIANLPSALSTTGMLAGLGTMFSASPILRGLSFLDPTTAGIEMGAARFMAARAGGAGVGAALGSGAMVGALPVAAGMAAYQAAAYTGQQFMTGAREQQQLGAQLSGIGFANPMAASGRGFGFGQLRQIGAMMREVDSHDPFTTMRELNQMMDQFTGMGMHRGVQDAREFGKKFKEFTHAVHEMAQELGTSMEEASRVFGTMRQSGFYSSRDVMGNTRSMQLSRNLGMDDDTFLGMQARGANVTRSALVSGRAGAMTSARFAQNVLIGATSKQSGGLGLFSDEELMDMTGAGTGAEAAAAMGTQFTGLMTGFLRNTPGGRAFLAGLGKQRGGSFTGEIDQAQLAKFASGNVRLSQLSGVGQGRLTSAQSRASFVNQEHKITSSLMESEQGVMSVMEAIDQEAKQHFRGQVADDDAMVLFIEKVIGADKQMAEKIRDVYKNYRATQEQRMRRMREEQAASLMQLEMRRNYTLSGLGQQVTGGISDLFAPVRQAGADFNVYVQETGQAAYDAVMGVDRAAMGVSSRRGSISRMAAGRALIGAASQTEFSDFASGTAGQSMAAQEMLYGDGFKKSLALQQKLASGGDLSAANIGLGDSMAKVDSFLASAQGTKVQDAILKAKQARALGDSKEADTQLARARRLIEGGMYSGPGASSLRGSGLTERYLAAAALKSGDASLAREIMGKGDVKSRSYSDVSSAHKEAVSGLTDLGVSKDLAEQLSGGGVGSELFIKTAGTSLGLDYFSNLAQRKGVRDKLSSVSADSPEYFEVLAAQASKDLGGSFSGEDVRAVMQASLQAKQEAGSYNWFGLKGGDAGSRMDSARRGFASAGVKAQRHVDLRTSLSAVQSAGTALGTASEEMKLALGPAYGRALGGLRELGAGGTVSSEQQRRVFGDLDALLAQADVSGVAGMAGGEELGTLAAKRRRALEMARGGDLQGIASAYGLSGDDASIISQIEGMGIAGVDKDKSLSVEEMEAAVKSLASQDLLGSLSAGEGGGIFLRGMTKEQQIAYDLQRTASSVQKLTEAVDAFHTKVFNPDEKTQPPAGK